MPLAALQLLQRRGARSSVGVVALAAAGDADLDRLGDVHDLELAEDTPGAWAAALLAGVAAGVA